MKAFISSTRQDLEDYRQKVAEAIERLELQGIRMEVFGARPEEATEVCLEEIDRADIFIGIYAHRYGYIPLHSNISITEIEYNYAVKKQKPRFCFVIDEDYPWKPAFIEGEPARSKLGNFKKEINKSLVRDIFTTPDDLAFKVASSLGRYLFREAIKEKLDQVARKQPAGSEQNRSQVARRAERLSSIIPGTTLLLVNDIPSEMSHVISLYHSLGITVTVATSSEEALSRLAVNSFDLVVSDMRRGNIPDEGMRFLKEMRTKGLYKPVIFTIGMIEPGRGTPPYAFGMTNRVDELFNLTFDVLERVRG